MVTRPRIKRSLSDSLATPLSIETVEARPLRGVRTKLGVIGLGRMGQLVVDRVLTADHEVVAFDIDEDAVATSVEQGATGATSIPDIANQLGGEKRIWLMVPAGDPVDAALDELEPTLSGDDIVGGGGNSNFQ